MQVENEAALCFQTRYSLSVHALSPFVVAAHGTLNFQIGFAVFFGFAADLDERGIHFSIPVNGIEKSGCGSEIFARKF